MLELPRAKTKLEKRIDIFINIKISLWIAVGIIIASIAIAELIKTLLTVLSC